MRDATRNFAIGLATIIALVGLGALLLFFGEIEFFGGANYRLTIQLDTGVGLRPKSPVEFNGVPIGLVESLQLQPNTDWPIRVVAIIDDSVELPSNTVANIGQDLLGSSATLQLHSEIVPGPLTFLPRDDTAVIDGSAGSIFGEMTTELDARMAPLLDAVKDFQRLADTYVEFGETLTRLIEPQTEGELEQGEVPNLATAVVKFNVAIDEATEALTLATEWLSDDQMRADARSAFEKANVLIDKATVAVDGYTELALQLQDDSGEVTRRLLPVADEMGATLREVRQLTKLAAEGDGTVAQMLNNPDLYLGLNDAATRLERVLEEMQLFLEKVQAEGVPIDAFGG